MTDDEHVAAIAAAVKELNAVMSAAAADHLETELTVMTVSNMNGCDLQRVTGTVKRLAKRL